MIYITGLAMTIKLISYNYLDECMNVNMTVLCLIVSYYDVLACI